MSEEHVALLLNEFIVTERSYVIQLTEIVDIFLEPARSSGKSIGVDTKKLKNIFSNICAIRELNVDFLKQLEERAIQYPKTITKLSSIINSIAPYLKLYVEYINNYPIALETFDECLKNKQFKQFIKDQENKLTSHLDFASLMITPVQRCPRYELLLRDLIKYASSRHSEYYQFQSFN